MTAQDMAELRAKTGLTQREFAETIFTNVRTLQAWEGGYNPVPQVAWEFAKLVHGHPDALVLLRLQAG